MEFNFNWLITVALALIALLFTIARATTEETQKVIGWGKSGAFYALIISVLGFSGYGIQTFLAGQTTPTRHEIFMVIGSIFNLIMYTAILVRTISKPARERKLKTLSDLADEISSAKERAIKNEIEARTLEIIAQHLNQIANPKIHQLDNQTTQRKDLP